ncbi:MAG: hypothetical protein WD607_07085 [Candidatus Paceibacterota bacterium]
MNQIINSFINLDFMSLNNEVDALLASTSFLIRNNFLLIKIGLIILVILMALAIINLLMKSLEIHEDYKGLDLYDFFGFERKKDKLFLEGPKEKLDSPDKEEKEEIEENKKN